MGKGPSCRRGPGDDDTDLANNYFVKQTRRSKNLKPRASMDPSEAIESLVMTKKDNDSFALVDFDDMEPDKIIKEKRTTSQSRVLPDETPHVVEEEEEDEDE